MDQKFLDESQYETESIRLYEAIYGDDFVSPGGRAAALELIESMCVEPGSRVLDVGCGLGGSAFVMAREFGLRVDGIDLSRNMLALARQKQDAYGLGERVRLRWGDCLELDSGPVYDAVYSRDVFLHIHDKARLFAVLRAALREGGTLLFTDYCCGPKPWSEDFAAYVEARAYALCTVPEYAGLLAEAGFGDIRAEDRTALFCDILEAELARIVDLDTDPGKRAGLIDSWRQKLARARQGHHRWGLFRARAPAAGSRAGQITSGSNT